MNVIIKNTNGKIMFIESSDGTLLDGIRYSGNELVYSVFNDNILFVYKTGERRRYHFSEVKLDLNGTITSYENVDDLVAGLESLSEVKGSAGTHKVADFSITTFAVSGAFDYLKTKLEHGFSLIQNIEIGEGQTFNAFTNYNILPNGDLVISTNSVFPNTNFVRITGIQ